MLCLNWQFAALLHHFQNQLEISNGEQTKQQTQAFLNRVLKKTIDLNLHHDFIYPFKLIDHIFCLLHLARWWCLLVLWE